LANGTALAWLGVVLVSPALAWAVAHGLGWTLCPTGTWAVFWAMAGSPLLEEAVYRTALQQPLALRLASGHLEERPAGHVANALAALGFVAVHAAAHGWAAWAWALPALVLGELYRQSGRVWRCVVLHAWFNASLWWASTEAWHSHC
jgi:hypothetical protein